MISIHLYVDIAMNACYRFTRLEFAEREDAWVSGATQRDERSQALGASTAAFPSLVGQLVDAASHSTRNSSTETHLPMFDSLHARLICQQVREI